MAKSIRQVKSKKLIIERLTRKLQSYRGVIPKAEHNLLQEFVSLDPVFAGRPDKFDSTGPGNNGSSFMLNLNTIKMTDTGWSLE